MTITKNQYEDIRDILTTGDAAAKVINENKRIINAMAETLQYAIRGAAKDGKQYARRNAQWVEVIPYKVYDFNPCQV